MKPVYFPLKLKIATKDGDFIATYSEDGLMETSFPGRETNPKLADTVPPQVGSWHKLTTAAIKDILAGRAPKKLPPLDLSSGTTFQRKVWNAMLQVGFGKTSSYGEIAKLAGNAKAVRAVGGACGANPIPVLVPCHRILAAGGKIGGFSSGMHWKHTLLEREGVRLT